jgi:hypothetical protein
MNPEEKRKESRDESDTYTPEQLRLMAEIKQAVNYLQQSGLDGAVVRKALLSFDDLCGLLVTADYRVMLCSPSPQEVKMGTLPKTVYLFYLRHPEGVAFSDLSDYADELSLLYGCLSNRKNEEKARSSIAALTNPATNSVSEKCACIKRAFSKLLPADHLGFYCVTGRQGGVRRIELPRDKVTWECAF